MKLRIRQISHRCVTQLYYLYTLNCQNDLLQKHKCTCILLFPDRSHFSSNGYSIAGDTEITIAYHCIAIHLIQMLRLKT